MRSKYMSSLSIQQDFLSSNPCSSIQFYTLVSAQRLRRMSITRESFSMREYDCIILVRMSWTFLEGESSFLSEQHLGFTSLTSILSLLVHDTHLPCDI